MPTAGYCQRSEVRARDLEVTGSLSKKFAEPQRQMRDEGLMDLFVEFRAVYPHCPPRKIHEFSSEVALARYIIGETYNSTERGKCHCGDHLQIQ